MTDIIMTEPYYTEAFARHMQALDGRDIIDELVDVRETLATLVRSGKDDTIGLLVYNVAIAYVDRLACREAFDNVKGMDADDARRMASAGHRINIP